MPPVTVGNGTPLKPRSVRCHCCSSPSSLKVHNVLVSFVLYFTPPLVPSTSIYQVLVSPGAIRLVSRVIGTSFPSISTVVLNVALFQVSQAATPPLPSGLSVKIPCNCAYKLFGFQPSLKGRCSTCMPRSPITPISPQNFTCLFQLIGLAGSISLECRKPALISMIWPSLPDCTSLITRCGPGRKGISELHLTKRPYFSAATLMANAASRSIPKGFSASRSLPEASTSR